jgi:hypothetical protein
VSSTPHEGTGPLPQAAAPDSAARGEWTGSYQSVAHRLDLPPKLGGLPIWKIDDGKRAVGQGKISMTVQPDGTIAGAASGPLGDQALRGAMEGDAIAAKFVPMPADLSGYAGTLVARREGDHLTGTFAAATSDGLLAREGTLTLTKGHP